MSKPAQKGNFLQTALFIAMLFMGYNLLVLRPNQAAKTAPADLFAKMTSANANVNDMTIVTLSREYQSYINDEQKAGRLTEAHAEAKKIESTILVADTQYKAGLLANDTSRVRAAYYTLSSNQKKLLDKPEWKDNKVKTYTTAEYEKKDWGKPLEWAGQDLYAAVVSELSARNKSDLIWGFIPGGYQLIDFLVHLTGAIPSISYAFAAFLLALVVRALVYPLTQKQLMFSRQMTQLAPLVKGHKEKYKNDPQQLNVKTMELYREYGVNPLAGCFPAMIQMPLFLGVYQCMLHYQFEFSHGTFLWINHDMSVRTGGFIAPDLGRLDYILILIYGVSMIVTTLLQPVTDPNNIKQQRMIGLSFAIMVPISLLIGIFPVAGAFVLYWTFTNILATAQSLRAYRMPMQPLVKVNAPGGGTYPQQPKGKWMEFFEKMQDAANDPSQKQNSPKKDDGDDGGTGKPVQHKPKKRK